MGSSIFHKLLIAIHVLPSFPVLKLILFPLDVLIVLPFPEDFVDDEEEENDYDGCGVEGKGDQKVVAFLPVEIEVLNIADLEGFDKKKDG